jgi:hypothetical protein
MFGYTRTTRACPVSQIHSSLSQGVRDFFQTHQLGDPDTETILCCETFSTRPDPGKLIVWLDGNPDTNIHLVTVLTKEWLIWARNGDQTGTVVTGAKLQVIKVNAFVRRRSKEMELEISGFMADTKEYMRGNLEMGPDPAAQNFCDAVVPAVLKAAPPKHSKFPRWMGGG